MLLLLLLLLLLRLIDLVSDCAADAAAVPAAADVVAAAVPDAGQGFIHPFQLYFSCSGGRDSECFTRRFAVGGSGYSNFNGKRSHIVMHAFAADWNDQNPSEGTFTDGRVVHAR